ncbi:hypothetical protein O6H91_03G063800 [Diphasiastrum complanatum]|nr:hypothetical protein O6H91_03G063800 [Diphasiastrum complanatum]
MKILLLHFIMQIDEFTLSKIWAHGKIQNLYSSQYLTKQYLLRCHKAIVMINLCVPFMSKRNTLILIKSCSESFGYLEPMVLLLSEFVISALVINFQCVIRTFLLPV